MLILLVAIILLCTFYFIASKPVEPVEPVEPVGPSERPPMAEQNLAVSLGTASETVNGAPSLGGAIANVIDNDLDTYRSYTFSWASGVFSLKEYVTVTIPAYYNLKQIKVTVSAQAGGTGRGRMTKLEAYIAGAWVTVDATLWTGAKTTRTFDGAWLASAVRVEFTLESLSNAAGNCAGVLYELELYADMFTVSGIRIRSGAETIELGEDSDATALRFYDGAAVRYLGVLATTHPSISPLRIRTAAGTFAVAKAT